MKINSIVIISCFLMMQPLLFAQKGAYQNETPETKAERMQWYQDARFGMFIHWGVYSQLDGEYNGKIQTDPKGEWIMRNLKIPIDEYQSQIVEKFNPVNFDAEKWVETANDAGIKYIVITTKHHDGFAMFDSEVSKYNIVDSTPFKRDVIKEISDACKKYDIKFGIYYSQAQDWYQRGGLAPKYRWDAKQEGEWTTYFNTIVKGQVTELFTNYGEISLLWWDSGRQVQNKEVADKIGAELVKLQPNIIVNPRLGGNLKGDFNTFEQVIPGVFDKDYNEVCLTQNRSWSYKPSDKNWKSPEFLLKILTQITSMGGNFLFNVGPNPQGEFPQQSIDALKFIGDWLKINGEAIYGTTKNPFYKLPFGTATVKTINGKTNLYLLVYDWPKNNELIVPGLKNHISKSYILGDHSKLFVKNNKSDVIIKRLPTNAPQKDISVIVLEINEPLNINAGYIQPTKEGNFILTPSNALLTIKPQFDCIPTIGNDGDDKYFDNWKNCIPNPRFKNTGNKAHWKVETLVKGVYKVIVTVATQNDENVITFRSRNKISFTLPNTGGMTSFKDINLGKIELLKNINTLTFTGGNKNEIWDFVRLKTIKLVPVK